MVAVPAKWALVADEESGTCGVGPERFDTMPSQPSPHASRNAIVANDECEILHWVRRVGQRFQIFRYQLCEPFFYAVQNVAHGRVSRVPPVQTAMRNCTRDEGGPFEIGNQVLVSSHRKLLWSKAMVVSVAETAGQDPVRQG
jgi:hypothetical protein